MRSCRSRHLRSIAVASVLLALAGNGCGTTRTQSEPTAAAGPPTIEVARVLEQPIDVTLTLPGELNPYQMVAIYPRVTGFVRTLNVDRGSRVRRGELIALLEAPELVAQRSEAQ